MRAAVVVCRLRLFCKAWNHILGRLSFAVPLQAMAACEVATTVSPTYAQEVSGHPAIAPHHGEPWSPGLLATFAATSCLGTQ